MDRLDHTEVKVTEVNETLKSLMDLFEKNGVVTMVSNEANLDEDATLGVSKNGRDIEKDIDIQVCLDGELCVNQYEFVNGVLDSMRTLYSGRSVKNAAKVVKQVISK